MSGWIDLEFWLKKESIGQKTAWEDTKDIGSYLFLTHCLMIGFCLLMQYVCLGNQYTAPQNRFKYNTNKTLLIKTRYWILYDTRSNKYIETVDQVGFII